MEFRYGTDGGGIITHEAYLKKLRDGGVQLDSKAEHFCLGLLDAIGALLGGGVEEGQIGFVLECAQGEVLSDRKWAARWEADKTLEHGLLTVESNLRKTPIVTY